MKSVMISIKPYWVFLIIAKTIGWNIDKEKTVEVRKSFPTDKYWSKVAEIYCTKDKQSFAKIPKEYQPFMEKFLGKVIGEFVCDDILEITLDPYGHHEYFISDYDLNASCLAVDDLWEYANGKTLYGWHISDLVIYDKPKELSEFYKENFHEVLSNYEDLFSIGVPAGCEVRYPPEPKREDYILTRPPQSWCYCEECER